MRSKQNSITSDCNFDNIFSPYCKKDNGWEYSCKEKKYEEEYFSIFWTSELVFSKH